jgi:hypothetical protein
MYKQDYRQVYPPKGMYKEAIEVHGPKSLKIEGFVKRTKEDGGGDLLEESLWLIYPKHKIPLATPPVDINFAFDSFAVRDFQFNKHPGSQAIHPSASEGFIFIIPYITFHVVRLSFCTVQKINPSLAEGGIACEPGCKKNALFLGSPLVLMKRLHVVRVRWGQGFVTFFFGFDRKMGLLP